MVSAALASIETAPRMLTAAELAALCVDFNTFCNKVKKMIRLSRLKAACVE